LGFLLTRLTGEQAVALFLELDYLTLKVFQEGRELLTALFAPGREVITFEDPPDT